MARYIPKVEPEIVTYYYRYCLQLPDPASADNGHLASHGALVLFVSVCMFGLSRQDFSV